MTRKSILLVGKNKDFPMIEEAQRRRGLARGLDVLLKTPGVEPPTPDQRNRSARKLPIAFLRPNPRNPRKTFSDEELEDLANSIKAKGVIQPIVVRPVPEETDAYEIIAGERRWRASQKAEQHEVPVLIIEASDREALEIALIENLQRAELNPLEEATAYDQLIEQFQYSHADLGVVIGKSRSHVANMLRLLNLSPRVKKYLEGGQLSAGHARALLTRPDADLIVDKVIEEGMTVRQVEMLGQADRGTEKKRRSEPSADVKAFEKNLSELLDLAVTLRPKGQKGDKGGEIRISYKSLDQLDDICRRLKG